MAEQLKLLSKLFDNHIDPMVISRVRDGQIDRVNFAFLSLFGYSQSEIIGKSLLDLFMIEKADRQAGINLLKKQGSVRNKNVNIRTKAGEVRIASLTVMKVEDNDDPRMLTIIHDVTEHKQTRKRLARDQEIIKHLIDNIPVMLVFWDPYLQKFTLNRHAESILGWTTADANEGAIMSKVFPDPVYRSEIAAFMKSLSPEWQEQNIIAKEGSIIPTTWTNTRLSDETMIGIGLDLRERNRVLHALQESDENFRLALAHSNFIPASFDQDQRYRWIHNPHPDFNPAFVIGKRDDELDDSQGAKRLRGLKQQVIKNGKGVREEIAFTRNDGTHWYDFIIEPIRDAEGKITGGTSAAYDITRQKLAELSLRESEERFRTMADGLPLIIWVTDTENRQLFVNQKFEDFFGITEKQIKEGHWQLLLHPDDAAYAAEFEACVRHRQPFHAIARVWHAAGEWRWIESWGRPRFIPSGEFVGYVGTSADITERKQVEESLRNLDYERLLVLDNVNEIIAFHDTERRLVWANNAYLRGISGVIDAQTTLESIKGKKCYEVWGLQQSCRGCPVSLVIETGVPQQGELTPENQEYWPQNQGYWAINAAPVRNAEGIVIGAIEIARDITKRKQSEDALLQLNVTLEQKVAERTAEAEQRAEVLRQLALELSDAEDLERRRIAMILHDDLQQYLAAIRFRLSSLIQDELSSPKITEQISAVRSLIDESIQKCRNLSHELSPPVLNQNGLIPALEWLSQDMKEKYGLQVKLQAEPGAEPVSQRLATVLFRSIRELLFNIVKHANTDSAVMQVNSKDGLIRIRVGDPGRGFDLDKIRSQKDSKGGFGLFNVEERIHFLGGTLHVKSAPGEGTRIDISVPNRPALSEKSVELMSDIAEKHTVEYGQAAQGHQGKIRILLADDHAVMRDGLTGILQNHSDLEVVAQADNGLEAVQMTDQAAPDVVLMDITMPEMDGIAATERILNKHPWVRIIGLSMHDDPSIEEKMRHAGACDYIYKASPSDVLVQTIRMSVNR